jgi:hypothetical protein
VIISALIMPRSATTQTRAMRKRRCNRSITGMRLPTSAVFPGYVLSADRPAVAIDEHGEDHLVQVRPMFLGEPATPERLAARAPGLVWEPVCQGSIAYRFGCGTAPGFYGLRRGRSRLEIAPLTCVNVVYRHHKVYRVT